MEIFSKLEHERILRHAGWPGCRPGTGCLFHNLGLCLSAKKAFLERPDLVEAGIVQQRLEGGYQWTGKICEEIGNFLNILQNPQKGVVYFNYFGDCAFWKREQLEFLIEQLRKLPATPYILLTKFPMGLLRKLKHILPQNDKLPNLELGTSVVECKDIGAELSELCKCYPYIKKTIFFSPVDIENTSLAFTRYIQNCNPCSPPPSRIRIHCPRGVTASSYSPIFTRSAELVALNALSKGITVEMTGGCPGAYKLRYKLLPAQIPAAALPRENRERKTVMSVSRSTFAPIGEYLHSYEGNKVFPSGIEAIDNAFYSGGVPAHCLTVLTGPIGSGKTVLSLKFAEAMARKGHCTVLNDLEMGPLRLKKYMDRHLIKSLFSVATPACSDGLALRKLLKDITKFASEDKPSVLIVDSAQMFNRRSTSARATALVDICANSCRDYPLVVIIINHYTKDGSQLAGPADLSRLCDIILNLEKRGDNEERQLSVWNKNRLGPSNYSAELSF